MNPETKGTLYEQLEARIKETEDRIQVLEELAGIKEPEVIGDSAGLENLVVPKE